MTTATTLYETELRIAAQPQTVFDCLTDPELYLQWMGRSVSLEPRPGGLFRVDINGNDVARGEYVILEPPSRLVWSWGWEGEGHPLPPGTSTVEITLRADGEATVLRMVHSGFVDADMAASHGEGWGHFLPRLVALCEGRNPGPDEWATPQESVTSEAAGQD
jgi:uncharacterized protein YndB with AHSA1/START domain